MTKTVQVLGSEFDGCDAHVTVAGKGTGYTLSASPRSARSRACSAIRASVTNTSDVSNSPVVVIAERKPGPLADLKRRGFDPGVSIVPPPSAAADDALGTPQAVIDKRPTGRGNCGDCLMEHAEVVQLRNDGTCPCCQRNHEKGAA